MKNYTEQAKAHIESLIAGGLTKQDIMMRYTANRVTIAHPIVGEDGKVHLQKVVFKGPRPTAAQAPAVEAQAPAAPAAQAPAAVQG
jgi:hypothetical protein